MPFFRFGGADADHGQLTSSNVGQKVPIRGLYGGVGLTVLLFAGLILQTSSLNASIEEFRATEVRKLRLNGQIVWLDEVLTMSARLCAATGNVSWETRYNEHVPLLEEAIKELGALSTGTADTGAAAQTHAANQALIEMETHAFNLVRVGDQKAAEAVLFSPEYERQKQIYADGMSIAREAEHASLRRRLANERWVTIRAIAIIMIALVIAIFLWVAVIQTLRRHWHARRQAELELLNQRSVLRNVLAHIPFTAFWKDKDLVYLGGNEQFAHEAGLKSVDDIPGRTDFEMAWTRKEAEFYRACDRKVMQDGEPILNLEETQHRVDGTEFTLSTSKVPLRDPKDGTVIGILGIYSDITERKRADAEREQLARQFLLASRQAGMAEVAAGVLHNVGNVLNSVNVSATLVQSRLEQSAVRDLHELGQLVREKGDGFGAFVTNDDRGRMLPHFLIELAEHLSEERREVLAEMESLTKNIDHIKHVVGMQQSYAGHSSICEPVELAELMEDAIRMNADTLVRHYVQIERRYDADLRRVNVDRHKILQILVNFVTNAKQAMEETIRDHRILTVTISDGDQGRILLKVSDRGAGIAPTNLGRIFEHGFTTKRNGHGFGLHSAALAAKEMGGTIHVHSDGPGCGTAFTLEIPAERVLQGAA